MDCLLQYTEKCLKTTYDIKKEKNVSRFCEKKKRSVYGGRVLLFLGGRVLFHIDILKHENKIGKMP